MPVYQRIGSAAKVAIHYSPDQARAADGKWTAGGGGGSLSGALKLSSGPTLSPSAYKKHLGFLRREGSGPHGMKKSYLNREVKHATTLLKRWKLNDAKRFLRQESSGPHGMTASAVRSHLAYARKRIAKEG